MQQRRRRATDAELRQGEDQMRRAQERMEREAQAGGEEAIQDASQVAVPESVADGSTQESQITVVVPVSNQPPTSPPPNPPEIIDREALESTTRSLATEANGSQAGNRTSEPPPVVENPQVETTRTPEPQLNPWSRGRMNSSQDRPLRMEEVQTPLFTPGQLQQLSAMYQSAPWVYGPPVSQPPQPTMNPPLVRPEFMNQEEERIRNVIQERDRQIVALTDQLQQDRREREELRKTFNLVLEENDKLKQRVSGEGPEVRHSQWI